MGFIWSQPESPLKASLLEEEPELILHTGDILLVPTSDIEIVLNCDPWIKVAVVVRKDKMMFAFCNGQYENISFFLQQKYFYNNHFFHYYTKFRDYISYPTFDTLRLQSQK